MWFKVIITVICLFIFFVRIIYPDINIDSISVTLLILALVPWFIRYIKSLEINGLGSFELVSEEKKDEIEAFAHQIGLEEEEEYNDYTFLKLRDTDSKLALASLRIEIEGVLNEIIDKYQLDRKRKGIRESVNILSQKNLLNSKEKAIILDIIHILNRAVHSDLKKHELDDIDWIMDLGVSLLNSLNNRLN